MTVQEGEFSVLYECDPEKNKQCSKTACQRNGGPCHQTKNVVYATDATKALMVIPMSQEEYNEIVQGSEVSLSVELAPGLGNRKERRHGRQK